MNMLESIDFWFFLAGLGIFLFGIYLLEESIRLLLSRAFKLLIGKTTGNRITDILTGTAGAAVLQSSSTVSRIAFAFTGAGLLSLMRAISVMAGAKIGATLTIWIVAVFGFKFQLEVIALPILVVGGLGLIFLMHGPRYVNISKFLVALGLLFLGVDYMMAGGDELAASVDLLELAGLGLWGWLLAGILLSAILQSGSTAITIVLVLLFTDLIDFHVAASTVIGANVGISLATMLGAMGGIPVKKQAALSQLIFSAGTAVIVFLLLPVLVWFILGYLGFNQNLVVGLALFHTVFNVTGVILFYPLMPWLSRFVQNMNPSKTPELSEYINNTPPEIPEAAIVSIRKEILHQLDLSMALISRIYGVRRTDREKTTNRGVMYVQLEQYHAEIFKYYSKMLAYELDEEEAGELERFIRASRSIMNATKNLYDLYSQVDRLRSEDSEFLQAAFKRLQERIQNLDRFVESILEQGIFDKSEANLDNTYYGVEEDDKLFIHSCAWAISSEEVGEEEITGLFMMNRQITQSLQMMVVSMQDLIEEEDTEAQSL